MATAHHNFDGGPANTTITIANSGQVPGNDPFDSVAVGGSLHMDYISGQGSRPTAEFVMGIATTGGSPNPYVAWTTTVGDQTEIWTRFYLYLTTVTSTNADDLNVIGVANAAGEGVGVWVQTTTSPMVLKIRNNSGTITEVAMATPLDILAWHRIEFHVIMGAGTGVSDLFLYTYPNADADIPDYTETISQSSGVYGAGPATQYVLGQALLWQHNTPNMYFSNWSVSDTDYLGPAPFRQGLGSPTGNLTNPVAIHMS